MMYKQCAILVCFVLTPVLVSAWHKPAFCKNRECPEFSVVRNGTGYQLRHYKAGKWVSSHFTGTWYRDAAKPAFLRLLNYIRGANDKRMKIPMTLPVTISGPTGSGRREFTISFFLPIRLHVNPPKPLDPTVFIRTSEEGNVYVRSYTGFPSKDTVRQQLLQLEADIGSSRFYRQGRFFAATYNRRRQRVNRHNEVWLVASR